MYEARWTDEILAEVSRTLIGRFGLTPSKVAYRESRMRASFPDSIIKDYEHIIPEMANHPKDRHVLAAAVRCEAEYLVTLNLKDFPAIAMEKYPVRAIGPAAFLKVLWALDKKTLEERLRNQAADARFTISHLLDRLAQSVPAFVAEIRDEFD
jgi:hypothetical protein